MSAALCADRGELQRFIDATFAYADRDSFVSLRCFRDDIDGVALRDDWRSVRVTGNADDLVDAAEDLATLAAIAAAPTVFAPPVCSFKTADKADAANVCNGLVITAEIDANPGAGRARLEGVLGPATVVVASGGLWLDPESGELLPKLHLHWRLEKPTRTTVEHDLLKEANQLATVLAGSDPTAVPLVHPLRWAGSWHRKATPRMARIVDGDITREIGLADALNKLRAASKANGHDPAPPKEFAAFAPAELLDITAAIACIPNDDSNVPAGSSWEQWNNMGLRISAATGGSDIGLALWLDWSKRSKAFNEAETRVRWRHYAISPPTQTNAGALFNLAREYYPDFVRPSELRRQVERDASEPTDWPPPDIYSKDAGKQDQAREQLPPGTVPDLLTLTSWLARDLPKPDFLLGELLSTTARGELIGPTGLGKTNWLIALGLAVADGVNFLHWRGSGCLKRVLYVDGEMSRRLAKQRLVDAVRRHGGKPETFFYFNREDFPDLQPLNTEKGQHFLNRIIEGCGGCDLLILDNVQALLVGDMKDEEPWQLTLPWVRDLTRRSIGQLWAHHTGHDESHGYGTKTREWQLDTVALMEQVERPGADIAFQISFPKARERTPDNRPDFEPAVVTLSGDTWISEHGNIAAGKPKAQDRALSLLIDAVARHGEIPPASAYIPPDTLVVPIGLWRRACALGCVSEGDEKATRRAFERAAKRLLELGRIGKHGEFVWPVR